MGKTLATVGTIITAAALIATGVGAAAGAGLLGASAAAAAGTVGTLTLAGISVSELAFVGAGLTAVGGLLAGPPTVGQTAAGTQVNWQALPNSGVPYLMGRTGTAGNVVRQAVAGQHNKYLHTLTVLSGAGPVKSISGFSANAVPVSFGPDAGEGASGFYQNRMWWKSRLGAADGQGMAWSATGSKDTPADHGGTPLPIANGHLSGLAATLWALEFDPAIYPTGTPKPLVVVEGVTAYDPRLDDTYPGGSGPQRPTDETTWAYSENPYLHALAWVIGRRENGQNTLGVHAPLNAIDVGAFVEGANVADANGWKLGGVVYSTDDKWAVLTNILQAGAGKPLKLGAKISCFVNTPRVSLDTLTGSDVVGAASIAAIQPVRSRLNTIFPQYREETAGWELVPTAKEVAVPAYIALDGGPKSKEQTYQLCQSAHQTATLARYDIEDGREFGPIVLPCKPRWMGYRPGDVITIDEPEYGLNGQECLILDREVDPATMICTLTLRSETSGKHAFALGQTADPPADPGVTGNDVLIIPAPASDAWAITATSILGDDGETIPAIVVTGETDNANVAQIRLEHRTNPTEGPPGDWTEAVLAPANAVRLVDTSVAPGVRYELRLSYITVRGVPSIALSLGTVTTSTLVASNTKNVGTRPAIVINQLLDTVETDVGNAITAALAAAAAANAAADRIDTDLDVKLAEVQGDIDQAGYGEGLNAHELVSAALGRIDDKVVGNFLTRSPTTNEPLNVIVDRTVTTTDFNTQTLSFIGRRNAAGSGFILDTDLVKVDDAGNSLTTRINALSSATSNATGLQVLSTVAATYTTQTNSNYAIAQAGRDLAVSFGVGIGATASDILLAQSDANGAFVHFGTTLTSKTNTAQITAQQSFDISTDIKGKVQGRALFGLDTSGVFTGLEVVSETPGAGNANFNAIRLITSALELYSPDKSAGGQFVHWDPVTGFFSTLLTVLTANIATANIITAHIADGAITSPLFARDSRGTGVALSSSETDQLYGTFTTSSANQLLFLYWGVGLDLSASPQGGGIMRLYVDGAFVRDDDFGAFGGRITGERDFLVVAIPAAGSHSIRITLTSSTSGAKGGDSEVIGILFKK